jgi:squalene synthase HpnC
MLTREHHIAERFWSLDDAYRYCEHLTHNHYENFPVASILLPSDKRKHVSAIYAFARTADDLADEPRTDALRRGLSMSVAERIDALYEWEEQLVDCFNGYAQHPVFIALGRTVERFQMPLELFQNLLTAFRSDVTTHRYETFDDVLAYCRNSANPVGRLVLMLFNYRSERLMEHSDAICTALQLTNFWQDVAVDLEKRRVYLPLEDIRRFDYSEEELLARRTTEEFRALMKFQVERTESLFNEGKPLLREVGRDLALELRATWHGGRRILEKIKQQRYDVFARRPKLTMRDATSVFFRALMHKEE